MTEFQHAKVFQFFLGYIDVTKFKATPSLVRSGTISLLAFLLGLNFSNILDQLQPTQNICPAVQYLPVTVGAIECTRQGSGLSYKLEARMGLEEFIRAHNEQQHVDSRLEPKSHGQPNYRLAVSKSEFNFVITEWQKDLLIYSFNEK